MKKYLIIFAIAVGMGQIDKAFGWMKTYGSKYISGNSVQQTTDGGYIFIGYNTAGAYLVKTDANGDTLWTRTYEGSGRGSFVQQTSDGGYIIAGAGNLIKTDSNGDTLWRKVTIGGNCVKQTPDGGYILTGGDDAYLSINKTDSLGNTVWIKNYSSSGSNYGNCIQQASDGGYIVIGCRDHFDPPTPQSHIWLLKANSSGDTLWTRTYGDNYYSIGSCVQQTLDGGYIVTGSTKVPSFLWLLKTDADGNTIWTKTYEGTGSTRGCSVQQTTDGNYIITGMGPGGCWLLKANSVGDTLWAKIYNDADCGNAVYQTSDGGYIIEGGAGGPCIFLLKTDSLGISDTTGIGEGGYNLRDTDYKLAVSPNPCVKIAKISYQVPSSVHSQQSTVSLKVYDLSGRVIQSLLDNKTQPAGYYTLNWDGKEEPAGIYFIRIHTKDYKKTEKLILVR